MSKEKKHPKKIYLEVFILLIIILSIFVIFLLAKSYIKDNEVKDKAKSIDNFSLNKIYKYPIVLDNVKNYNLPYKRHIDASKSTYNIYIKSTDNIVLNVTEIINITYFDPSIYPNEVIDELNLKSINYNYFPESNPIDEEFYKNQDEIEKKPEYPNNWLDIYNYPIEDINNDTITNYCNTYNEINSNYSLTCNKDNYSITLKNSFNLNNTNSYIFNTEKFEIILPVKRGTKLSDYLKELKTQNIIPEKIDNIE